VLNFQLIYFIKLKSRPLFILEMLAKYKNTINFSIKYLVANFSKTNEDKKYSALAGTFNLPNFFDRNIENGLKAKKTEMLYIRTSTIFIYEIYLDYIFTLFCLLKY
jgi:hypothetical protein